MMMKAALLIVAPVALAASAKNATATAPAIANPNAGPALANKGAPVGYAMLLQLVEGLPLALESEPRHHHLSKIGHPVVGYIYIWH